MARLILVTAEGGQQAIDLRAVNSLGRHPNNSIQLLDKIVSKEHCIIEQRGQEFVLRDLGSLNGTYVNGERVRGEQALKHGDEIALGSTRARYDDGSGPLNFAPPAISPGAIQQPAPPAWGQPQQPMPSVMPPMQPPPPIPAPGLQHGLPPQQPGMQGGQQQRGSQQMPYAQPQPMPPAMAMH